MVEKLNQKIIVQTQRPGGRRRIQTDFSNCPTMAEQHTAHLTDINHLIAKYKPDELAAYIYARTQHRSEIIGHDFSKEPDLQEAKNIVYRTQQAYEELPEEIRKHFKNHLEFFKFIDNPHNVDKLIKLGLLEKKQVEDLRSLEPIIKSEEPKLTKTVPLEDEETKAMSTPAKSKK